MRWALGLVVVLIGAAVATQASGRTRSPGKIVNVPLPAANSAAIESFGVTVKPHGGKLGRLKVAEVDDKQLGNASSVLMIQSPTKAGTTLQYTVYVLIRRFASPDRAASTAHDGEIGLSIDYNPEPTSEQVTKTSLTSCGFDRKIDKLFEGGSSTVPSGGSSTITLLSVRPTSVQDSPSEEVLDNVVALGWTASNCPGQPEGDDPGDK